MSFDTLTNQLIACTLEFLDWQDYIALKQVCKRLASVTAYHEGIWARACLRNFFSFDLEMISECYESAEYKTLLKEKIGMFGGKYWKELLECTKKAKKNMFECFKAVVSEEGAESLVCFIYKQLKEPMLPPLKLKRESIMCSTKTLFQDKLSQVLYEDFSTFENEESIDPSIRKALAELKENENALIAQIVSKSDREDLLRARWYNNEIDMSRCMEKKEAAKIFNIPKQDIGFENTMCMSKQEQQQPAILLAIYTVIYSAIYNQCHLIFEYLSNFNNVYDLVAEYTIRWNAYTSTMLHLEENLKVFTDLINKAYETCFPGYPSFPKFSIWRLMVKIWLKEVYEKCHFSVALNQSFLRILNNHRERILKMAVNSNFVEVEDISYSQEFGMEIPKELFVTLNTKRQRSVIQKGYTTRTIENAPHQYFSSLETERQLLSSYLQSIVDLSMNEVSIHYLDCTILPNNYPYCDLEQRFLENSYEFCEEHMKMFYDSPNYYYKFLKSDLSFLADVLTGRTSAKLEKIQVEKSCQLLQEVVSSVISKTPLETFENIEIPEQLQNCIVDEDLQEFFDKACAFVKDRKEFECSFANQINMKDSLFNYRKLIALIELYAHADFRSNFDYLNKKNRLFTEISARDQHILMYNKSKNIPSEIGDIDSLFYDLDKNVDIVLLERLYENYKQQVAAQEASNHHQSQEVKMFVEEEVKMEETREVECLVNTESNSSIKRGKTLGMPELEMDLEDEEINFDELDLDNLPTLDMLSLRK